MEQNTTNSIEEREKEIEKHYKMLDSKIISRGKWLFIAGALAGILSCSGSLIKIASVANRYESSTPIVRTYNQTQQLLNSLRYRVKFESSRVVEYVVPETIQKNMDEVLGLQKKTVSYHLDDIIMQVEHKLAEMKNIKVVDEYQKRITHIYRYGLIGGNIAIASMAVLWVSYLVYSVTMNMKKNAEIAALTNP